MGPRRDRRSRLPYALAALRHVRGIPDECPRFCPRIDLVLVSALLRLPRLRRLLSIVNAGVRQPLRKLVFVGKEAHQIPAHGRRHVDHQQAASCGAVGRAPYPCEVAFLCIDPPGFLPAAVDVDCLPVAPPAGCGLVQASSPGDALAGAILDDPGFLVEDRLVRYRMPIAVTRHCDLHIEIASRHHPRQQFQRVGGSGVWRRQRQRREFPYHASAQCLAALDGLDLCPVQRASDDEAHHAAVADQALDAA